MDQPNTAFMGTWMHWAAWMQSQLQTLQLMQIWNQWTLRPILALSIPALQPFCIMVM